MRYNGKNYKSISFTVLKDKLLSKEKKQIMGKISFKFDFLQGCIYLLKICLVFLLSLLFNWNFWPCVICMTIGGIISEVES